MGVFLEYKKGSEKFERTKRCNQITLKQLDEDEMNIKIASKYNNSENGESFTNGLVCIDEGLNMRTESRSSNEIIDMIFNKN